MIQGLFNKAKGLYAAFQDLHPLICMAGHKYDLSLGIGLVDLPDQIDPVQLLPAQIKIQEIEIGPRIFCIKPSSSLPEAVRQAILAFCPQLSMDRFTSSEIVWSVKESSSQTITGSIKNLLQNNCFYRDRAPPDSVYYIRNPKKILSVIPKFLSDPM